MRLIRLSELAPPSMSTLRRSEPDVPMLSQASVGEDLQMAEPATMQETAFKGSLVKKKNPTHSMMQQATVPLEKTAHKVVSELSRKPEQAQSNLERRATVTSGETDISVMEPKVFTKDKSTSKAGKKEEIAEMRAKVLTGILGRCNHPKSRLLSHRDIPRMKKPTAKQVFRKSLANQSPYKKETVSSSTVTVADLTNFQPYLRKQELVRVHSQTAFGRHSSLKSQQGVYIPEVKFGE